MRTRTRIEMIRLGLVQLTREHLERLLGVLKRNPNQVLLDGTIYYQRKG